MGMGSRLGMGSGNGGLLGLSLRREDERSDDGDGRWWSKVVVGQLWVVGFELAS